MRMRTCFVGESIDVKKTNDAVEESANDATYENDGIIVYEDLPEELTKRGVILPNSVQERERANDYFRDHHQRHHNSKVKDVNKEINDMQNKIYEYFSQTHGQVKDKQINEYENQTKKPTKKPSEIIEISKSEAKLSSTKIMEIF